ncbi:hypothetical protein C8N25_118106 [Algoriphagus antarcticus]|uniref:Uncharacterized protein n=1 Tax=Algoriphagus antarcticus TaxID=238540 RepID=A0A3E0DN02_9BACT|nr:hypothetical protein C8N25_118106 [Algoriphagus antarcticus]
MKQEKAIIINSNNMKTPYTNFGNMATKVSRIS